MHALHSPRTTTAIVAKAWALGLNYTAPLPYSVAQLYVQRRVHTPAKLPDHDSEGEGSADERNDQNVTSNGLCLLHPHQALSSSVKHPRHQSRRSFPHLRTYKARFHTLLLPSQSHPEKNPSRESGRHSKKQEMKKNQRSVCVCVRVQIIRAADLACG